MNNAKITAQLALAIGIDGDSIGYVDGKQMSCFFVKSGWGRKIFDPTESDLDSASLVSRYKIRVEKSEDGLSVTASVGDNFTTCTHQDGIARSHIRYAISRTALFEALKEWSINRQQ